jgi:hypothetical protein
MFRPGSPSIPSERVASGLIWRFSTLDCISDNLDCFGNGFGSGSFLDIRSHCFYVAKPFPEEVTDILDPLCDADSEDGESTDFCSMVKVLAVGGMVTAAYHALRTRRSNTHLHRNMVFHLQSGTCWMRPSRTCAPRSTSPRIQSRCPRI